MAVSPDGRYRLRLDGMHWVPVDCLPPGRDLMVGASLLDTGEDVLLAVEDPRRRFTDGDGGEIDVTPRTTAFSFQWSVGPSERAFSHALRPGARTTRLGLLAYAVPVLRVRSWIPHAAEGIGRNETVDLEAPPFRIRIETGEQVCRVTVRGGGSGFLDRCWAADAMEVVDARGRQLEVVQWWGHRESSLRDFAASGTGILLHFPLRVSLRVPGDFEKEVVPFEFRDVPLPPRPGAEPAPGDPPPGRRRSGWSEEREGLALRITLPESVLRGDMVEASLITSAIPERPPGTPSPEALVDGGRLRLVLRNRESGARVELRRNPGQALGAAEGIAASSGPAPEGPVRREWPVRFPLVAEWDALVPGIWEASATLEIPAGGDPAAPAAATLATPPVPILVEKPPEESRCRRRLVAPTGLVRRPGKREGTVEFAFGPREAEVVEVEVRNGFSLGVDHGSGEFLAGSSGWYELIGIPEVVDTIPAGETGHSDRVFVVEVYEGLDPFAGGDDFRRVLWRREFPEADIAEEIEVLRR